MKKLFLSLAVIASVSLFSCANKEKADAAEVVEGEAIEVVEEAPDTTACCGNDTCAAQCDSTAVNCEAAE